MNLYFAPMACSLASRIAAYEAGAPVGFTQVDTRRKKVADGSDFFAVNPMGQVPALRLDDGSILTENTAVLPYLADRVPASGLMPASGDERARAQQWLGFITTELHKALFVPLLDPHAPEAMKAYVRSKADLRLGLLQTHLDGREFMLDRFSVVDAYLVTVLNWAPYAGVDLAAWPAVQGYHQRMLKRPAVARAVGEEFALYKAEQAKAA
ncbi:MAG: glutathione binding-like protein [Reyranellaceae bacterium]